MRLCSTLLTEQIARLKLRDFAGYVIIGSRYFYKEQHVGVSSVLINAAAL